MLQIPLQALPAQEFDITLNGQNCTITLYQRGDFMYMDLAVDSQEVFKGNICLINTPINQERSPLFNGVFGFVDLNGTDGQPYWENLEEQYQLLYLTAEDFT